MNNNKTSILSNGLLWFGASISIAEIWTGTLFTSLGLAKGISAIIIGHIIGCVLLYFAGLIGGKTQKTSMETTGISFGYRGNIFFAILNVVQLLGWTAVMIISGAKAIGSITNEYLHLNSNIIWCILIAAFIIIWILLGLKKLEKINIFAIGGLLILTIILSIVVFNGDTSSSAIFSDGLSFGAAIELSVAMPLSWLPLISDYTKNAAKPKAATLTSTLTYFLGSCWMYIIGLGAALYTGQGDISIIMLSAGLGMIGVIIVLFSTVTTTYLDVYSAGISYLSISKKFSGKTISIAVCLLGTLIAVFTPIEQYQNFLYFIGSVFAPMVAILITDYFILKKDHSSRAFNIINIILWIIGFIIYRLFLSVDTIIGSTVPVMIIVSILCILVNGGKKLCSKKF